MAHLHIPDGVLPVWLWGAGWAAAVAVLLLAWRAQRDRPPQRVADEGALRARMPGGVAMKIPFGPVESHLTLAGPIGVLLGPAGAFQAAFIASAILSLIGHGGLTLIGLNALLLGIAATLASPGYRLLAARQTAPLALAGATGVGHTVSGLVWLVLVLGAARLRIGELKLHDESLRLALTPGVAFSLLVFAVLAATGGAGGRG